MDAIPSLHRYGDDYLPGTGDDRKRVLRAIGPEALPDARYRLPPLEMPAEIPVAPGPQPAHEYVVDIAGPIPVERALAAFSPTRLASMGFPRVWGRGAMGDDWLPLAETPSGTDLLEIALTWELASLLSEGSEAARDLAAYTEIALGVAGGLGMSGTPREPAAQAAARARNLLRLRERFGRSVELRLSAAGIPFPARDLWRTALSLGLEWGDMDLFHWFDPTSGRRLFTVSAVGRPGYFLPERVEEGERIAGIALGFELPHSPAPLPVFDRMALALAYFREHLGGHPVTGAGHELDGETLAALRDELQALVAEMEEAGMPPGSPAAARFF